MIHWWWSWLTGAADHGHVTLTDAHLREWEPWTARQAYGSCGPVRVLGLRRHAAFWAAVEQRTQDQPLRLVRRQG